MRQKIVTFGEIMLRMTRPEKLRIIQGSTWDGYFGGRCIPSVSLIWLYPCTLSRQTNGSSMEVTSV